MRLPALAVAIVHYRAEALLDECLHRLLSDSARSDLAVCVVDNGSESGLPDLEQRDPRLTVVRPGRNLGFAAGVNCALRHLPTTPHVLLLNPDVLLSSAAMNVIQGTLDADARLGAATCRLLLPDGSTDPACRRRDPTLASALAKQSGLAALFPRNAWLGRYQLRGLDPDHAHRVDSASGAFLMLKRAALDAVNGLDERFFLYGEDLDLCRTIRGAGWEIAYAPEARALHVKGSGRVRDARTTGHFYRAMWTYYRKWGRHRRNPLVLAPLAAAVIAFAAVELARNAWRRPRGLERDAGTGVAAADYARWSW